VLAAIDHPASDISERGAQFRCGQDRLTGQLPGYPPQDSPQEAGDFRTTDRFVAVCLGEKRVEFNDRPVTLPLHGDQAERVELIDYRTGGDRRAGVLGGGEPGWGLSQQPREV
jgi:hypothetical protein